MFNQLFDSAIFMGILGASFAGLAAYLFRNVPIAIYNAFIRLYTVEITIRNDTVLFDYFSEMCADLIADKHTPSLNLISKKDDFDGIVSEGAAEHSEWAITIAEGTFLFWKNFKPYIVQRVVREMEGSSRLHEEYKVRYLGRSKKDVQELVKELMKYKRSVLKTRIFAYSYAWHSISSREKRPFNSIIMPSAQRNRLLKQVETFLEEKDFYIQLGIPYKHNILLHGPPGTGKTSTAIALAGQLNRDVYLLNLSSIRTDESLIESIHRVPSNGVLLIEDIDATASSLDRLERDKESNKVRDGVSLSCLLNILDGALSSDGRIIIMTTNHLDRLDPAIVRPGRVDTNEYIDSLSGDSIKEFYLKFHNDEMAAELFVSLLEDQKITGAKLQQFFLTYRYNSSYYLENIKELLNG